MRKLLREEDLEELLEQSEAEPAKKAAPTAEAETDGAKATPEDPRARVLELQKTAGNRAVGAALSRWPVFGAVQATWPKERQMILDDGTAIPIESFQEATGGTNVVTSSTSGSPNRTSFTGPGEIVVTVKMGKYSTDLFRQAASGSGYKTVEIVIPTKDGKGIRFILTDVLISSYSVSGHGGAGDAPLESLSLSFKKREFNQDPPPPRR
jgi:type VI protein secretion system component Hcp